MEIEDYKRVKEELEKEIEKNDKKLYLYDERKRMTDVNSFESKLLNILAFSTFSYFGFVLVLKNFFLNFSPSLIYPLLTLGGSLGVGSLINIGINKKFKTKERFKAYSKARTEQEKLEEIVYYQVEFEKVKNRNKVLRQAIDTLNFKENMLLKVREDYNVIEKDSADTTQDMSERIEKLNKIIEEQFLKTDVLSTQKILHNRFWRIRSNLERITDTALIFAFSALSNLVIFLPFIFLKETLGPILGTAFFYSVPATFLVFGAYTIKRHHNYKKVFNIFNLKLNDAALATKYKKFEEIQLEEEKIRSELETAIRNTSESMVELKNQESKFVNMQSRYQAELTRKESLALQEELRLDFGAIYREDETKFEDNSLKLERKIKN